MSGPKRKVALLMGFCGTGYHGMQFQKDENMPTIESELLQALGKCGAVEECNMDLSEIGFQRCARVHALGQVVSAKLILPSGVDDESSEPSTLLAEEINKYLPEQIRCWGHVRVAGGFNAKNRCSSRVYEYLLPTENSLPRKERYLVNR
jgi:tRNA pseudouridine38-40 synthase